MDPDPPRLFLLTGTEYWIKRDCFVSGRFVFPFASLLRNGDQCPPCHPPPTTNIEFSMFPNQTQYDYIRPCFFLLGLHVFFRTSAPKWTPCPPRFVSSTTADYLVKQNYGICFLVGLHVFLYIVALSPHY